MEKKKKSSINFSRVFQIFAALKNLQEHKSPWGPAEVENEEGQNKAQAFFFLPSMFSITVILKLQRIDFTGNH